MSESERQTIDKIQELLDNITELNALFFSALDGSQSERLGASK